MAKSILINEEELHRIFDVVSLGNEYEVHSTLKWIRVENDNVTITWKWDLDSKGSFVVSDSRVLSDKDIEQAVMLARQIEFSNVGAQLGMIYDELMSTGTLSKEGPWATHITNIKKNIPKGQLPINLYQNGVA